MADAVIIPGRLYGADAPLLAFAGAVAERRGANVIRHAWTRRPPGPTAPEVEAWVCDQVAARLDPPPNAAPPNTSLPAPPLLIGKSLGTNAAALAADRSLPAVWLTPLLATPWVVAAMDRATAPFLLVGGTADDVWDGALARRLSPHVLEVDDADHLMYVPGPLTASVAVLGRVVSAVERFLDEIGWQPPP